MRQSQWIALIGIASLAAAILAGCGSGSGPPAVGGDSPAAEPKVQEYVGDGGGSLKPWPAFVPLPGTDQAARQGYPLGFDVAPKKDRVPKKQISWYKLDNLTATQTCLVCIQPTANEDADLYVMDGRGSGYYDGSGCIAYSVRFPAGASDQISLGYAPDWVVFDSGATQGWPSAQVAVYGVDGDPRLKNYRIEAENVWGITVNGGGAGGSIEEYDSHWWQFDATNGTAYTVTLTATSGDPDLYVYQDRATEFVDSDTGVGGGSVSFTATDTVRHIIRVYAWGSAASYSLAVTSP